MKRESISSGVSAGLKKVWRSASKGNILEEHIKSNNFIVKIANTIEEREAVFKLGYQEYLKKGFINENSQEWLIRNYDFDPNTISLIVKDKQNNLVGSVTLVFDKETQLPAEKIFSDDLNHLRNKNEKITEISRFVIDPNYRNSKEILVLLFNYLYIYAYNVKKYTCLIIEVNPRHTAFYKELLNFKNLSVEKACPSVQNAPAMLLYLQLNESRKELINIQFYKQKMDRSKSLLQFFINIEQENLVAFYLEKQVKPMTQEEKIYFGFSESGINRAICV